MSPVYVLKYALNKKVLCFKLWIKRLHKMQQHFSGCDFKMQKHIIITEAP